MKSLLAAIYSLQYSDESARMLKTMALEIHRKTPIGRAENVKPLMMAIKALESEVINGTLNRDSFISHKSNIILTINNQKLV